MKVALDTSIARINFALAHRWLSTTYWSKGISLARVKKGFVASTVVVGAYLESGGMVGIARCVSDTTRFGYITDVFVDPKARKQGIALSMVQFLIESPRVKDVEYWYLITKDAHRVYEKLGFRIFEKPERFMKLKKAKPRG